MMQIGKQTVVAVTIILVLSTVAVLFGKDVSFALALGGLFTSILLIYFRSV